MRTILHVIPSLSGGGAERQLALLAAAQTGRRRVHLALRRRGSYLRHLERSNVTIHELGDLRRGHPLLFARLASLVRAVRPDLIQTWLLQMDLVGGVVSLALQVPWILTERSIRASYYQFPLESRLRFALGRHATAIVANSSKGASDWRSLGAKPKIATIRNAVNTHEIEVAPPLSLDDVQRHVFLAVGRLVPQKAHDVLVRATSLVPREHSLLVVVLGEGPEGPSLEHQIAATGQRDRVRILPFRDHWWGALKTVTAMINISRFEGQPNVVLEAMAASCPVIVSDIEPHREFLDDDSACFVPPNDAHALARAMTQHLRNLELARARAARARRAVSHLTPEAAADAYEAVYDQVLSSRR